MLAPNLVENFIRPLEAHHMEYMITGSVAAIVYGEPRLTHDVDLVLDLKKESVAIFAESFPLEEFYCPPLENILLELERESRAHFNLIHHQTGFKADCYLRGKDPLHGWAFERRKRVELSPELAVWIAPPEYVILRKLEYYREGQSEKHLKDISAMLKISAGQIDLSFIESQVASLGLLSEWKKAV